MEDLAAGSSPSLAPPASVHCRDGIMDAYDSLRD